MAVNNGDNTQIWNSRTIDELIRWASLEQAADNVLWIRKFGRTGVLTANTPEDIWSYGGTRALPYTAGETISIVSSSIADDNGSTGAQYLQVAGLDTDYNLQSEVVVLDGTTPVVTANTYITIDRARVVLSGSGGTNAGNITLTGSTSSNIHAYIPAGEAITQQSHFTVPAGYTLFTIDTSFDVYRSSGTNAARGAEVDQMVHVPVTNTTYRTIKRGVSTNSGISVSPRLVANTPAKTTLWYEVNADTNNTVVSSSVSYLLVKGDYNLRTEI